MSAWPACWPMAPAASCLECRCPCGIILPRLNGIEQSMQMGHAFEGMQEVYTGKYAGETMLERIRDKFERLALGDHTLEELQEKQKYMSEEQKDRKALEFMAGYIKHLQEGGEVWVWDKMLIPQNWRNLLSVVQGSK